MFKLNNLLWSLPKMGLGMLGIFIVTIIIITIMIILNSIPEKKEDNNQQ